MATTPISQPQNQLISALKRNTHRAYIENFSQTYDSTLVPTLDATLHPVHYVSTSEIYLSLSKAWRQDLQTTLKVIWKSCSIQDGKGEKQEFYRCVTCYLHLSLTLTVFVWPSNGCRKSIRARPSRACTSLLHRFASVERANTPCLTATGRTYRTSWTSSPWTHSRSRLAHMLLS